MNLMRPRTVDEQVAGYRMSERALADAVRKLVRERNQLERAVAAVVADLDAHGAVGEHTALHLRRVAAEAHRERTEGRGR